MEGEECAPRGGSGSRPILHAARRPIKQKKLGRESFVLRIRCSTRLAANI
jgi:hypothetical protein